MHTFLALAVACLVGQLPVAPAAQAPADGVEVRYARAQVQLAEANLNRVLQTNKRLARSVPSSVVAEYRQDVLVANKRLQQATLGQTGDAFQVWLERAAAEHKAAETTYVDAESVNKRAPGTFDPLDVERYRLRAEVAKLQFERGQTLVDSSRAAQLQWQADLLDNQLQRLKEESSRVTPYVRSYPAWRW